MTGLQHGKFRFVQSVEGASDQALGLVDMAPLLT
jgi:hypothetical protein